MENAMPVDLISPDMPQVQPYQQQQPQQPYTPPSLAPSTPLTASAKEFTKAGQPVVQEVYTKTSVYSPKTPEGSSILPHMLTNTGVAPKEKSKVLSMANIFLDPNCQDWTVQVERLGPAKTPEGYPLAVGAVQTLRPPMPYPEVYERVRDLNGGGRYIIRIFDETGLQRETIPFSIDTMQYAPIPNVPNNGQGPRVLGGAPGAHAWGAGLGAEGDDEVMKLRKAEQVSRAKQSAMTAEYAAEETARTFSRRRQAEIEAEERKAMAPAEIAAKYETQRMVDGLKSDILNIQHMNDRRLDQMQQNFEKMFLTLTANGNKKDDGGTMLVLVEMIKGMNATMAAVITGNNKPHANENMETLKLISASNEKIAQMAMQNANTATNKSESLMEKLIMSKLEHPENAVKQALDMREAGWNQAKEMFAMMDRYNSDREPDEVINPEGGFWSNLGNVVLAGLQKLTSGGIKGGANTALTALNQMMKKPEGSAYSQAELEKAAQMLVAQEMQKRGVIVPPLPATPPALPVPPTIQQQPQQQQRRLDPRKIFDRIYEIDSVQPQVSIPIPQPQPQPMQPMPPAVQTIPIQQQQPQPLFQPKIEDVEETPQPTVEEFDEDEDDAEEEVSSLSEYVNEAIEIALKDLETGRKEHDWVDLALNKFDAAYLQRLVEAPRPSQYDIAAHIKILQEQADPEVFARLYHALVASPQAKVWYPKFVENFIEFLEYAKENMSAAT